MVKFAAMANHTRSIELQTLQPAKARRVVDGWQTILDESVRDPAELCRLLKLPPELADEAKRAVDGWPLCAPRPYLARIRPGDPTDPLLLQVLPRPAETIATPGYRADPLGEADATCAPGLLQKYRGRTLILATGTCSVHCRFCFRRHFPHERMSDVSECEALRKIAADRSIHEVVLSGGDPLMRPDAELGRLADRLAEIPHLRRLRIHSRMPITIPQRVTRGLTALLRSAGGRSRLCGGGHLTPIMVVHVNHPAEIDADVAEALGRLVDAGIPVLSQSVLLQNVNDRAETLAELFERLVDLRVIPYYLHRLDPVAGTAHFDVPKATGVRLLARLRTLLPGYAVPRYVCERPGAANKEMLS